MNYEHLLARIPPPRASKIGVSAQDIDRVVVVPQLVHELRNCLQSDDESDLIFGLYFAERLRTRPEFCAVANASLAEIATLIRSALAHPNVRVSVAAMRAFVSFERSIPTTWQ